MPRKNDVISEFCQISAMVAKHLLEKNGALPAHDCFCESAIGFGGSYQFDQEVLAVIKTAVRKHLGQEPI